ncbi:hypothetical protein MM236_04240 [Belliella sp. DSM 107340]|uniref:Cytochrome c domain-containing protein n=1 Tax=Belliella calami TaxID=2923436 RepID=A0ABS9UKT5_9BACT|nr:hypothetical protein [Belliella calami]MCH7397182.1 hypothetical protein [Belliella calami]
MKNIFNKLKNSFLIWTPMVLMVFVTVFAVNKNHEEVEKNYAFEKQLEEESKQAFLKAYKVFMHPRCVNCHPAGDAPLQGDDSHIHSQNVKRGIDGKGLYALKCSNCHQEKNIPGDNMPPGHDIWQLPPAHMKMVFEGKSPRQLAEHFMDNEFTGFVNWQEDLIHHVEHEPLVLHSWSYGTRPPLSHEEFVESLKEWIEKGAALPD